MTCTIQRAARWAKARMQFEGDLSQISQIIENVLTSKASILKNLC
jgi:hypothetical protein